MAVLQTWLMNHKETDIYPGDGGEKPFARLPQWSYLMQLGPQVGPWLPVRYSGNSSIPPVDGWVMAEDLEEMTEGKSQMTNPENSSSARAAAGGSVIRHVSSVVARGPFPVDLTELVNAAAESRDLEPLYLLALLIAESGLNVVAMRHGTWPDVSYGLGQQTVAYASVGDRSDTPENRLRCFLAYANPEFAIAEAADRLAAHYKRAVGQASSLSAGDAYLEAMYAYNFGHIPSSAERDTEVFRRNSAAYRRAVEDARTYLR